MRSNRYIILSVFMLLALKCMAWQVGDSDIDRRRDSVLARITGARMPQHVINIIRCGAKGDGRKDCHPAFVKAMRQARKRGGARVVVPAGTYYMCGPLHLESNVCLELQEGATLKFSPNPEHYLPMVETSWEGTMVMNYSPFIYGRNLHNVSIIGRGTIDGNAAITFATWRQHQKPSQQRSRRDNHLQMPWAQRTYGPEGWLRPQLVQLYQCKGVTLEGVKITNSPFWCIHLLKSENIICRSLRYDAKLVNNDGIDPEHSRNVLIEDISFDNGDDNVAIKSGRDNDGWAAARPSENIVIRRCRFKGLHAVVIGSEMSAGVRNVFVEDCTFGGYLKRAIYIKTNPDRGGFVSDIYVRRCRFGEVEDLVYVTSMYAGEGQQSRHYTDVARLYIDSVSCERVNGFALVLQGIGVKPIRDVVFTRVDAGSVARGISVDNTENLVLNNCHLGGRAGAPSQASAKDNVFGRK